MVLKSPPYRAWLPCAWLPALVLATTAAGFALPARAELADLRAAVTALANALEFEIGSAGDQSPGNNEDIDCPGAVPDGTEDIYDFGQDGVPDYAQMALLEALFHAGDPHVRDAVTHMSTRLKTERITVSPGAFQGTELQGFEPLINLLRLSLPDLLETIIVTLGLIDLPEGVGETRAERRILYDQTIDAITLWGCVDNPANLFKTVCIEETTGVIFDVLTGLYDEERANLNSRVGGHVPLGDGTTVLDRWNESSLAVPDGLTAKVAATADPVFLARVDAFVDAVFAVVPGDINGDGVANAIDVQLVTNAALGIAFPQSVRPDINADGELNALDVQLAINAVLGLPIVAFP